MFNPFKLNSMKKWHLLLILLVGFGLCQTGFAQEAKKVKALVAFQGNFQKWGVKRGDAVYPKPNFSIFEVEEEFFVIVPSGEATVLALTNTIRESSTLQTAIFGSSYEAYKKKEKKKKKPKPSIQIVCKSKSNCNGSCSTILDSEGKFIRCSGNCCEDGPGVWKIEDTGIADSALF